MQCLYMIYIRGSPQSLCNAMFIYDLHSRKSSEFDEIQCLYMIYIRGSPQSLCNAMFIYDLYSRKSSEFMQYNVYI